MPLPVRTLLSHFCPTTKTRIVISVLISIAGLTKSASVPGHPEIALRRRPEQVVRNRAHAAGEDQYAVFLSFLGWYCTGLSMDPWRSGKGRKISMYILGFSIRSSPSLEVCAYGPVEWKDRSGSRRRNFSLHLFILHERGHFSTPYEKSLRLRASACGRRWMR